MEYLLSKIQELIKLDYNQLISNYVEKNKDFIIQLNREQLADGFDSDGGVLMRYVDDPYFKTREKAIAYQNWKEKISKSTTKPKEVMDFFITGYFHNEIFIKIQDDSFIIDSNADFTQSIERKTKGKTFGLTEENKEKLKINDILLDEIWKVITA